MKFSHYAITFVPADVKPNDYIKAYQDGRVRKLGNAQSLKAAKAIAEKDCAAAK